jgi:hypothetical protein
MKIKEYALSKSAQKTAKENNLIFIKDHYNNNVIFDFTVLEELDIAETEKEYIKADAISIISAGHKEQMYTKVINNFVACDGIAYYNCHRVYNTSGKRLYVIMQLASIKHIHGERKTVFDPYYNNTETIIKSGYDEPYQDYEIA